MVRSARARDGDTRRSQVRDSPLHVDRVPVHDRRDDQIAIAAALSAQGPARQLMKVQETKNAP
jgi:hypothetical protein